MMVEPSKTYEVINNRVYGWIDALDAMRQVVEKVLSTERFEYPIYTDNYGIELIDLIGAPFQYAISDIERRIKEALSVDERIIEVSNFLFNQVNTESLIVAFNVKTVFGQLNIQKEVKLSE